MSGSLAHFETSRGSRSWAKPAPLARVGRPPRARPGAPRAKWGNRTPAALRLVTSRRHAAACWAPPCARGRPCRSEGRGGCPPPSGCRTPARTQTAGTRHRSQRLQGPPRGGQPRQAAQAGARDPGDGRREPGVASGWQGDARAQAQAMPREAPPAGGRALRRCGRRQWRAHLSSSLAQGSPVESREDALGHTLVERGGHLLEAAGVGHHLQMRPQSDLGTSWRRSMRGTASKSRAGRRMRDEALGAKTPSP